jgi:hypothetical protein
MEIGSIISMLGLLVFAAREEVAAFAPAVASALEQFLAAAPPTLW